MNQDEESLRELKETQLRLKELYLWTRRDGWTWQAVGAVSGLCGGVLAAAVGALLSAVAWVRGDETGGLSMHGVGSILLLSMLPLLIMGAHCLDLLDRRMERSRYASREGTVSAAIHGKHARTGAAAVVVLLMMLCGIGSKIQAQQTIFNVPSTDVLDNRAGGQFGFEQPLSKTVTLAADYFTGKHAAGYFTPGVIFKVGKKATGYAGYSVGNQNPARGNHFFLLELGYNFN